jgi:hypothetical protein
MRVLVCGSRTWADEAAIQRALEGLAPGPTTIIHGGARDADHLAGRIATSLGYAVEVFEADWSRGRRAGLDRNIRMLDSKPDLGARVLGWAVAGHPAHDQRGPAPQHHRARGDRAQRPPVPADVSQPFSAAGDQSGARGLLRRLDDRRTMSRNGR